MAHVLEHQRTQNVTDLIGDSGRDRTTRPWWMWVTALAVLATLAVALGRMTAKPAAPAFSTAAVERGTVRKTITATGRTQALTTVQVGTQISGTVSDLYVDFNSQVKRGQVIARIDPSQLQAQLTQAQANLAAAQASATTAQSSVMSAEAAVQASQANVERLQSLVDDAQLNLNRTRELVTTGIGARKELDTAQAQLTQALAQKQQALAQVNQAKAQAQAARSQLAQARAQATQASAAVQLAAVNLEKTIIRAPIDGVIVARNVDVGQTVAASLQAPTLFLIANDLTRMQVLADIDEADVGQLQQNSRVTFTVDAYPSDTFEGHISQIRLAPQTVQNVVTYTAVVDVSNPEGKLKPGMTANVTAIVAERENVLTLPNAALRFRPEAAEKKERVRGPVVWRVGEENKLDPVQVRLGLSDGVVSEVLQGQLTEGDRVATAAQNDNRRGAQQQRGNNPFMPSRGPRSGGAGR